MEPPTLGAALLCSSGAGTDLWLYPEVITLWFTVIGVFDSMVVGSVELSMVYI